MIRPARTAAGLLAGRRPADRTILPGLPRPATRPRGVSSSTASRKRPPDAHGRPLLRKLDAALRSESMPPEGEPRPSREERETLARLARRCARPAARAGPRRRTRRSVASIATSTINTIRDLIGLDLRPADDFPADDIGYGFDNIADVLATPPLLVEMELAAAESVIDAAFRSPEARRRILKPPAERDPAGVPQVHAPGPRRSRGQTAPFGPDGRRSRAGPAAADLRHPAQASPTAPSVAPRPTTR